MHVYSIRDHIREPIIVFVNAYSQPYYSVIFTLNFVSTICLLTYSTVARSAVGILW
jgi:hypothetical protein